MREDEERIKTRSWNVTLKCGFIDSFLVIQFPSFLASEKYDTKSWSCVNCRLKGISIHRSLLSVIQLCINKCVCVITHSIRLAMTIYCSMNETCLIVRVARERWAVEYFIIFSFSRIMFPASNKSDWKMIYSAINLVHLPHNRLKHEEKMRYKDWKDWNKGRSSFTPFLPSQPYTLGWWWGWCKLEWLKMFSSFFSMVWLVTQ